MRLQNYEFYNTMKMTKTKKQHYVPQFILRNFAIGKKQKAKLWVLDKRTATVFPASVRDVAHENMFYEYHGDGGDYEFEPVLEKLDTKVAGIIHDLLHSQKLPDNYEHHIWLSYFVSAQLLRTPVVRRDIDNMRDLIIHKFGNDIVFDGDSRPISQYGPEDSKAVSIRLLKDVPRFAKILQKKVWTLAKAPDAAPFIIGDNPVSKHNMIDRGPRGNLGLENEGIEVYAPLSPRLSLQILCPKIATAALLTQELQERYSDAVANNNPVPIRPENVEFMNSLQVIWAERFVYARHEEHLGMPLDMLRTNPELRDGTGVRQKPSEV